MTQILLNLDQATQFIIKNKYPISSKTAFHSRCSDGRYENSPELPALAFPGADAANLALLYATANTFGFQIDPEKALAAFLKVIGGENHLTIDIDSTGECTFLHAIKTDSEAFGLSSEQIKVLEQQLSKLKNKAAVQDLSGDHKEAAIFVVHGNYGIEPRFELEIDSRRLHIQSYVYHQSLTLDRYRALSKELIESNAATLLEGCDDEYLYEVLSNTTDDYFFEAMKKVAPGMPIYGVHFNENGTFDLKDLGKA